MDDLGSSRITMVDPGAEITPDRSAGILCCLHGDTVLLSEHGQALAFTNLLCLVISAVAWVGLLDTITGRYFTHELAQRLSGYVQPGGETVWADAYRLGFLRAAGPIEHPIWLVLFASLACSLRYRPRYDTVSLSFYHPASA